MVGALQVLELGGNHLEPALAHSLMKLIAEQVRFVVALLRV
jgi:hypothetical protein